VVEIIDIIKEVGQPLSIVGYIWKKENFFVYPCQSSLLEEWAITSPSNILRSWALTEVKSKMSIYPSVRTGKPFTTQAAFFTHPIKVGNQLRFNLIQVVII